MIIKIIRHYARICNTRPSFGLSKDKILLWNCWSSSDRVGIRFKEKESITMAFVMSSKLVTVPDMLDFSHRCQGFAFVFLVQDTQMPSVESQMLGQTAGPCYSSAARMISTRHLGKLSKKLIKSIL